MYARQYGDWILFGLAKIEPNAYACSRNSNKMLKSLHSIFGGLDTSKVEQIN